MSVDMESQAVEKLVGLDGDPASFRTFTKGEMLQGIKNIPGINVERETKFVLLQRDSSTFILGQDTRGRVSALVLD